MKTPRTILVASLAVVMLWGGYRAYRAHANLVTLNVHDMDVRRVVSKLEWQTWERIVVSKNVGGRVTLNVHSVPLEEVLNIVGLQTDSRWTRLYPIYSNSKSLATFKQVLLGKLPPAGNGWLALQQLAAWQQAGLGGFANTLRSENKLVSARFAQNDIAFTALALSRFSKAQVVPEDGIPGSVTLQLQQVPFDKAVAKVARFVRRKWDRIYTLQPLNAATLVRKAAPAAPNTPVVADSNQVTTAQSEPVLPPDRALEALVSTMTPEQRQQTLDQIGAASSASGGSGAGAYSGGASSGGGQQQMSAGGSAAAQAAQAAAQADLESRIENRLKNGTIDQRLAHDRRVLNGKQAPPKQ